MLILEKKVSNAVVEYFDNFIENAVLCQKLNIVDKVCTVKGFQTKNVIDIIDKNYITEISNLCNTYLEEYYESNLDYYYFIIDYLHLIKYHPGGYQIGHTHCKDEDHSFILYLNDCQGITRIYLNGGYKDIQPQKNKIIFFNSALFHTGLPCDESKKVLVGSIRFLYKVWRNRS